MARPQRNGHATLLKLTDEELVRHEVLAFQDGYADARDNGQDGFWLNPEYGAYAREQYATGFKRGLRVWRVTHGAAQQT